MMQEDGGGISVSSESDPLTTDPRSHTPVTEEATRIATLCHLLTSEDKQLARRPLGM